MIFLASASPQRALLLAKAGIAYDVVASAHDEEAIDGANPQAVALERACHKARGVGPAHLPRPWTTGDCLLAADTVTSLDGVLYGKPADNEDATRILSRLQGTIHTVTTAHCCLVPAFSGREEIQALAVSMAQVTMRAMSPEEIAAYVASGESAGRSGAYAIQASGDRFVTDVQGSMDTVIGLHVATVCRLYQECTGTPLPMDVS